MNTKIHLFLPFLSNEEAYSTPVGDMIDGEHVPLGIYYLAGYIREHGYPVAVTDAQATKLTQDQIIEEIRVSDPAYVGISATTVLYPKAVALAQLVKREFPHIVTILGGRHITSNWEHAMSCPAFDYGVVGEGEITAVEMLDALTKGEPLAQIPGVVYRDAAGQPHFTGDRALIEDLDILPFPAFDLIDDVGIYRPPLFMHKAKPLLSMITSRGCPSKCTFCATSLGKTYRKRSAQNIFAEIKDLMARYQIREVDFLDDNFLLDRQRIYDLFDMMRAEGLSLHWTCMARIGSVNYEFLKYLRDNGCWSIAFGIESGDPAILKVIRKGLSLERTEQVLGWCRELGILTRGFFIIGHPTETVETIDRTIDYACKVPLDLIMTAINTPFPGTQQYDEAEKYGTLDKTDWSQFSQYNPVFVPHGLTKDLLVKKQREMYIKFYFRPKHLARLFAFYLTQNQGSRKDRLLAGAQVILLRFRAMFARPEARPN